MANSYQKALLIVPHFWDPVCPPLGVASLKPYAEGFGHQVTLFDFNTISRVIEVQDSYFELGKKMFPHWRKWNIQRNGTEMLALHQIAWLYGRDQFAYQDWVAEILNMDGRAIGSFMDMLDIAPFDAIFERLYGHIETVLERLLRESQPDVIGCHLNNSTWPGTLFILQKAKELLPNVRTVVGGPGPIMGITSAAEEVEGFFNSHDFIDYFVVGEGEDSFVKILDNPDLPAGILDPIKGMSLDEMKESARSMDEFPLPDYGDLYISKYLTLSVSSARGCPFECSFCAETVFWKGFRAKKSRIFTDLKALADKYRRSSFYICDSLSNQIISPLTKDILAAGEPFSLDCYLRADKMCTNEERTKKWKAGGLSRARLGLESASQRILDDMVKMTTPENMAKSLYALAKPGVQTSTLWIVAYPGEAEAEFNETLGFIRENKDNIFQADAWLFQYHPTGLAHSNDFDSEKGSVYRFSPELNRILAVRPYVVDNDLSPAERFDRLERFTRAMEEFEIPNPYTITSLMSAVERWKALGHYSNFGPFQSMVPYRP